MDVGFELIERIGVLSKHNDGWAKELNIVSWNNGEPKWDIRDWDENNERMTRGITLVQGEMDNMINAYSDWVKRGCQCNPPINFCSPSDIEYDLYAHIGLLSVSDSCRREINYLSWNKQAPKVDIRSWINGYEKMSRGIALSKEEMDTMVDIYKKSGVRL